MQQLDVIADYLNDADLTGSEAFQHPEAQIAFDPIGAHDRHQDAALAEVSFMQAKAWRAAVGRPLPTRLLAHDAADAIASFSRGELLREAGGRFGLPVGTGGPTNRALQCRK
ncbi:hypothetical protein I6F11_19845 [Ensifer sp. NBAIM29]|nr:hypothetical protein [Ensifer sp. NBAIM29]